MRETYINALPQSEQRGIVSEIKGKAFILFFKLTSMNSLQYVPGTMLNDSHVSSYLLFTPSPRGRGYYRLHLTNGKTEAWKDQ